MDPKVGFRGFQNPCCKVLAFHVCTLPTSGSGVFPSTNGEGSLIFKGAYRSRRSRLQNREIKISLCLLNFEGCGTLDLGEIYQFGPWKRFAFDFRQHPFVHNRSHYTPGATALRTWYLGIFNILCVFAMFAQLRRLRNARSW